MTETLYQLLVTRAPRPAAPPRRVPGPPRDRVPFAGLLLDGMEPQLDFDVKHPAFKCDCGIDRVYRVLALLPRDEVQDILDQNDKIEARCEFCSRLYSLGKDEIAAHFSRVDAEDQ